MSWKKLLYTSIISLFIVCVPLPGMSQQDTRDAETPAQSTEMRKTDDVNPKIGLVLSGGGARGFAHIGAIKVLEAIGMPIDFVVGTSMGSIVGGLYAAGYSAEELETVINEVDWEDMFSDTPPRNLWSYQKKRIESKYIFGVGFNRKGFTLPGGLTSGQKISMLLAFLSLPVSDIDDFDHFPIPYRAVAADIATGEEVVLDHGSLADAMRASMSVPGVFTPVTIDDHLLVDGGVLKNLPVDVAKALGADIVIAIDISSGLQDKEQLGNPLAILNQMIGLQMQKVTEEQRALADVLIIPDLGEYTSSSFGNAREISTLGETATRMQLDELRALLDKIRETRPAGRSVPSSIAKETEEIYIEDIVIEGNSLSNDAVLLEQLQYQKGAPLNPDLLDQSVTEIFSSGRYETVKFVLAPGSDAGKVLKLQLQERPQSPYLFRFGMNYASRFEDAAEDKMVFLANATLNNLTGAGSWWSTDLQFVNIDKIESDYFQPLGKGFFVMPTIHDSDDFQLVYEDKESVARYNIRATGIGVRFGAVIQRLGAVAIGYVLEDVDADPTTAAGVQQEEFPAFDETVTSVTFQSRLDHLDTFPFPHSGSMLNIDYQWASETLGGEADFHKLSLDYWQYVALTTRNTLGLRLQAGTDFDTDIKPYKDFLLGGRDSFVGYKIEEIRGAHIGVVALEYRYQFSQLPSPLGGGIFAIANANVGNVWRTVDEITDNFTLRYGGSLGIGVDTMFGPVQADFAIGDGGRQAIYLNIGYTF